MLLPLFVGGPVFGPSALSSFSIFPLGNRELNDILFSLTKELVAFLLLSF